MPSITTAARRTTFALLALGVTTWPVGVLQAQEATSTAAMTAAATNDRWVELAIMGGLVAVIALLRWIDRPTRTATGSWARLPFGDEDPPPPGRRLE